MRVNGYYGDNDGPRVVDIRGAEDRVLIHIHSPDSDRNGEKIWLDVHDVEANLGNLAGGRFARIPGRVRKQKLMDIEYRGPVIWLWIRSVDGGTEDGWAISVPAGQLGLAFPGETGVRLP